MPTLYRDYRPQKFADILGQNHLKISLENELAADNISQAYLFCGPRAVGKTTMARVLAQAVNCERRQKGESEPCGECSNCLSIKKGNFLDVTEIDAASNTGVDNVRDNIIAATRLAPSNGHTHVFIIDEVHMLSLSAFNALLKIIEEPPRQVLFILCTTEVHKVPATIISRCQRFDFKRISPSEIVKKLKFIASQEKIEISQEVLEDIARQSGGHLRDAESLFGQVLALGGDKIGPEEVELVLPRRHNQEALDLIELLAKRQTGQAVALLNKLVDSGISLKNFLEEIILMLRKIMLQSVQAGLTEKLGLDFGEQLEIRISQLASELALADCLRLLRRFLDLSQERQALISQLPLEIAIVELCLVSENKYTPVQTPETSKAKPTVSEKKSPTTESAPVIKSENNQVVNTEKLSPAPDLSAEEVLARWPEVLVKIKKFNHSLSFVLQNCLAQDLKSGIISLQFKYKFHRDRILDPTIKAIMESTLAEVFAGKVEIKALLDENLELNAPPSSAETSTPKPQEKASEVLSDLLNSFGGETV